MSLRARLMAFVLLMLTCLSILFCAVAYWKMSDAVEQEIHNQIKMAAEGKAYRDWETDRKSVV